jgi:hypothetical protein
MRKVIIALTLLSAIQAVQAQSTVPPVPEVPEQPMLLTPPSGVFLAFGAPGEAEENKKDPAYAIYKKGYDAILDEQWTKAIEHFAQITSKHPKSDYLDDAEYWTAYALSHTDRKKAIDAYRSFTKKHPRSRYIDDVVADLGNLDPTILITTTGKGAHVVGTPAPGGYSYAVGSSARLAEAELRKSEALMRKMNKEMARSFTPRPHIPPRAVRLPSLMYWETEREEKLDADTRVRLEALYAIGNTREDETAFHTLKDVVLDGGQNVRLRLAAIEVLSDFKKFDVMPVFLELAKKDTNERIQDVAIEFIGRADKDKNKSVEALTALFNSLPGSRKERLETVLFTIADVGNDRAVDFLATVARTHANYELRSDAVYYLGTIGGEKARTVLYQILRNK